MVAAAGGIFSLAQVTGDAVDGLEGAIRDAVPTAVAPTPVGTESGSLLRGQGPEGRAGQAPARRHPPDPGRAGAHRRAGQQRRRDAARAGALRRRRHHGDHAGEQPRRPGQGQFGGARADRPHRGAPRGPRSQRLSATWCWRASATRPSGSCSSTTGCTTPRARTARKFAASAEPEEYIRTYLIAERFRGAQPSPFRGRRLPHRARQRRGDRRVSRARRGREPDRRDRAVRRRRRRRADLGVRDRRSRPAPAAAGGDGARETERHRRHPAGARRRQPDARQRRAAGRDRRPAPARGRRCTWSRRSCARACTTSPPTSTASCATRASASTTRWPGRASRASTSPAWSATRTSRSARSRTSCAAPAPTRC